jgi:hypothetical protein
MFTAGGCAMETHLLLLMGIVIGTVKQTSATCMLLLLLM